MQALNTLLIAIPKDPAGRFNAADKALCAHGFRMG